MALLAKHHAWCRFQSSLSEETGGATPVPIFRDRHELSGLTASDIAEAHRKDLEAQDQYGVRSLTYWFDESRGTGFRLIDAPDNHRGQQLRQARTGPSRPVSCVLCNH